MYKEMSVINIKSGHKILFSGYLKVVEFQVILSWQMSQRW